MAKTTVGAVAIAVLLTACVAARIDAAPRHEMVVVLHVTDDAHVSGGVLAEAEHQATRVFYATGVRAVWSGGAIPTTQPDGAFHVEVVIRSTDTTAGQSQLAGIAGAVLGRALPPFSRAYIFYDRVCDYAMQTDSSLASLLGAVIAHEVGHLLLPASSHSQSGIMRANWDGRIVRMPEFTVDQGTTIRTRLAAASAR